MSKRNVSIFTNVSHVFFPFSLIYRILRKECQDEIYFNTMGVFIYGGKQLLPAYEIPYDV